MQPWPHAPAHHFEEAGTYIVTAATYAREFHFFGADRLDVLQGTFFRLASEYALEPQAWSFFPNHYHFVAVTTEMKPRMARFLSHLHTATATEANRRDGVVGRKVWHQYWDTRLTFERSYLARLNYVHHNPVKHKVVQAAWQYRWCSARWFESNASTAFFKTVIGFKTDRVNVPDDF